MLVKAIPEAFRVISSGLKRFKKVGLGFSGGSDSLVLLHITLQLKPDIPVVFVNTYHQFPETYQYVEEIKKNWNLNFYEFKAERDRYLEFKEKYPEHSTFVRECCLYHKISPLLRAIKELELDGFLVGIRGVEHPERNKETYFSPRKNPPHYRIHPLLKWSRDDILDYIAFYNLPVNPLYQKGYTSIGCVPCTSPNPDPSKHERLGRDQVRERIMKVLREAGYT